MSSSFIAQWRAQLPDSLAACRAAIKAAGMNASNIDPKYGVFAAGLLWTVREAGAEDDQREAVCEVCGGIDIAKPLLAVLHKWSDYLSAARELSEAVRGNVLLQTALESVIIAFRDDLEKAEFITVDLRNTTIQGAIVNIGGKQYFYGDVAITIIQQQEVVMICPPPPEEPVQFGGRDSALAELRDLLARGELTAITAVHGLGGIGKTTLARKLANVMYQEKIFRAVLWASVTRAPDPLSILQGWAKYGDPSYSLPSDPKPEQVALHVKGLLETAIGKTCEHCEPNRVLVVLDDVWDDQDGKGKAAARLLKSAAPNGSTILITTRSENLAIDLHAKLRALDRMSTDEGLNMLRTYDKFAALPDDDLRAFATSLGGHPLALDLGARRVQKAVDPLATLQAHTALYLQGLLAGLEFRDLKIDQGEQREDSLTTVLSYSYEDLAEADRARFRALGLLPPDASFDLALLAALWDIELAQVADHCNTLRLLSLIQPDSMNGLEWYRQHPLLRSYALALLRKTGELEHIFARYADKVIVVAAGFNKLPPEEWHRMTLHLPHIHVVGDRLTKVLFATSLGTLDGLLLKRAQSFAYNVTRYLANRREVHHLDWLEMGLTASRALADSSREAFFLNSIGMAWDALGEKQQALEFYDQALPIFRVVGDRGGEASMFNNIGSAWLALGEKQRALKFYDQALPIFRVVGDRGGEATTLNNIGMVWSALGENQRALEFFDQALPLYQAVGDRRGEATTLNNIGVAWLALGENQQALEFYNQALPLRRMVGDRGGEASTLNSIGKVWSALGENQQALEFYNQALSLYRAVGDRGGEASTLNSIGSVWSTLGGKRRALEFYDQALSLHRAVGDRGGEASTLNNIGWAWDALGEKQQALEFYEQALPVFRAIGDRRGEASTLNNIGMVWSTLGGKRRALEFYDQALPLHHAVGDRGGEAITLNNIGSAWSALGDNQRALEFYGQALLLCRAIGDRGGEASTLNNIGKVWSALGENQRALEFFNQALPLYQAVGDGGGEAITLNNIGGVWLALGENQRALEFFDRTLPVFRVIGDRRGEGYTYNNMAHIFESLGELDKAIECAGHSAALLAQIKDVNVENSHVNWERLKRKRDGQAELPFIMPKRQIEILTSTTIAVKTSVPEKLEELRAVLQDFRKGVASREVTWTAEVALVDALLAVLDDQSASLPDGNPYRPYLGSVLEALIEWKENHQ